MTARLSRDAALLRWKTQRSPVLLSSGAVRADGISLVAVCRFSALKLKQRFVRYLVDPASSHMLVSKIKPCMSKYKPLYGETADGSLKQLLFT